MHMGKLYIIGMARESVGIIVYIRDGYGKHTAGIVIRGGSSGRPSVQRIGQLRCVIHYRRHVECSARLGHGQCLAVIGQRIQCRIVHKAYVVGIECGVLLHHAAVPVVATRDDDIHHGRSRSGIGIVQGHGDCLPVLVGSSGKLIVA